MRKLSSGKDETQTSFLEKYQTKLFSIISNYEEKTEEQLRLCEFFIEDELIKDGSLRTSAVVLNKIMIDYYHQCGVCLDAREAERFLGANNIYMNEDNGEYYYYGCGLKKASGTSLYERMTNEINEMKEEIRAIRTKLEDK